MARSQPRHFTNRPFEHQTMNVQAANETWNVLKAAIHKFLRRHDPSDFVFEELHTAVYNLVIHNYGPDVYRKLEGIITQHLDHEIAMKLKSAQRGEDFLTELYSQWLKYNKSMELIREILMYLEKSYVKFLHKTPLHELGLNLWCDRIVRSSNMIGKSSTIGDRLLKSLIDLLNRERMGEVINRGLIRNLIQMLSDLRPRVYYEEFESRFLRSTADFYRRESQQCIETNSCSDYLKEAERRLNEEVQRVAHYLDPQSALKITAVVVREIIGHPMKLLVEMKNSGLVSMLIGQKYDDLARMFGLFRRLDDGLQIMSDVMVKYLKETGGHLVKELERLNVHPVEFVQRLLDEKDKYDTVIRSSFGNDLIFRNALKSAFEYFINLSDRSPEFLSLFLDDKLRNGFKGVSEEAVETELDKIMTLFRYLKDKDVFETFYRKHLAKRLLYGRTQMSDEKERSVIVKLKTECGPQFTSKLECMYTDMQTSKDTLHDFNKMLSSIETGTGPTLAVQVLTTGLWPIRSDPESDARRNLPTEILTISDKFKAYYLWAHRKRRLTWQHNDGTAVLKTTFGDGRKHELNVSTNQMCILLLFNVADTLSYREIEQATALPPRDLKRNLQSLACVRGNQFSVLRKEPMSKDISEADVFHFNDEFSSEHSEVKIFTDLAQKESDSEEQETRRKVDHADRNPAIDAAIVRIIKSRGVLGHNVLISEVITQLQGRFLPNPSMIKMRIEALIEREVMERDPADWNQYQYLA